MKRILLTSAAVVALATSARAADLPTFEPAPAPIVAPAVVAYNFSGFYIGANVGYAFGDEGGVFDFDDDDDGFDDDDDDDFFDFDDDDDHDLEGISAGVRVGADAQFGSFVIGGVVDANFIDLDADGDRIRREDDDGNFDEIVLSRGIDWYGTARLRAGFALDRFLIYGTGGFAYAQVDFDGRRDSSFNGVLVENERFNDDEDLHGYQVGVGVEALITPNLSVDAEYLYTDFGDDEFEHVFADGRRVRGDNEIDFHTIRIGANLRFNSGLLGM